MKKQSFSATVRLFLGFFFSVIALQTIAQTAPDTTKIWTITGGSSINFSQVSLSNWSEGGDGSVSGTFLFNMEANKKKNKHYWDNNIALEYGLVNSQSKGSQKSVDKINFTSKYGFEIGKPWYLSALYDFKSQFANGYNYPNTDDYISKFMAPGYMTFAFGFDYKPNDNFSAMLSPLSSKLTFVLDDYLSSKGSFGVDAGKKARAELGAYVKLAYVKKSLLTNVDFETKLDLFSNYLDNPQNVDINWDVKFDMKINKFLSANFGTSLRYDDDIKYIDEAGTEHGPRVQLKQMLGVGLSVKF